MTAREQLVYNTLQGQFYMSIFGRTLDDWSKEHFKEFMRIATMYRKHPITITKHVNIMRKIVSSYRRI